MRLTCPACGAVASLEAMANDKAARGVAVLFGRLPPEVAAAVPAYLALFRPEKQGLRWTRAEKILAELVGYVREGFTRSGRRCRPSAAIWADALAQVADRNLRRPLKGHGYLLEVVLDLYDSADARWESERDDAQRHGRKPPARPQARELTQAEKLLDVARYHFEQGAIDEAEFEERKRQIQQQYGGGDG